MATAASKGDIKTLKYLHENNCPINQWATTEAAGNGHFTALCWLYSNGYPLEIYALYDSIANRHIEIVCWLLQKGCPMDDDIILRLEETVEDKMYDNSGKVDKNAVFNITNDIAMSPFIKKW